MKDKLKTQFSTLDDEQTLFLKLQNWLKRHKTVKERELLTYSHLTLVIALPSSN